MPVYLNEYKVGTDPAVVGFPHVLLCMAVVCMTQSDLYGVHMGAIENTNATTDLFKNWLNRLNVAGKDIRAIYTAANFKIRFENVAGPGSDLTGLWKVEMNRIASRLDYHGPIYGFDTSIIAPKNGTYMEFRNDPLQSVCRVFYKLHEHMVHKSKVQKITKININDLRIENLTAFVDEPAENSILNEVDYSTRLLVYFTK